MAKIVYDTHEIAAVCQHRCGHAGTLRPSIRGASARSR